MAPARVMLNYTFEERSIDFQKCCLGGKIVDQDDINKRLDSSETNFMNSCWKCFMKGHKIHGQCDTDSCPVKYSHRRVVNALFKISDFLEENPEADLPYIKAADHTLDEILKTYQEAIDKQDNPSIIAGLHKIKTFFGGN
jgi:hypothetical protein